MTTANYLKLVKYFGLYHAIAILPFVFPIISEYFVSFLGSLHLSLGLSGTWFVTSASTLMFLNLFAGLALIWALLRFYHPSVIIGKYEAWAMLFFSFIVIYYVYMGASVLWLIIPLVDIPGGLMHLLLRPRKVDG